MCDMGCAMLDEFTNTWYKAQGVRHGLNPAGRGSTCVRLESTWSLDSFPCDDDVLYVEEVFSMMSLKEICYG